MALYALFLAGSNFFAPIIAGFINDGQGWKWVLYWCSIFCAIGFVFLFFFMEETNYYRRAGPIYRTKSSGGVKPSPGGSVEGENPTAEKNAVVDMAVGSIEDGRTCQGVPAEGLLGQNEAL